MNYFTLFFFPVLYNIDGYMINDIFQILQRKFHPDNFSIHTMDERKLAQQKSAVINYSYKKIKKSIKRVENLLCLQGFYLKKEKNRLLDTEFLIKQLYFREEWEKSTYKWNKKYRNGLNELLGSAWKQHSIKMIQDIYDKKWFSALDTMRKLIFFYKIKK